MKDHITVHPSGQTQLGKDSVEGGYIGRIPRLSSFHTQIFIRPGAKLLEVKESLQLLLQDIEARIRTLGEDALF